MQSWILTKEGFDFGAISFPALSSFPCLNFNPVPAFYLQASVFLSQLPLFSRSLSICFSSKMRFGTATATCCQFSTLTLTWPYFFSQWNTWTWSLPAHFWSVIRVLDCFLSPSAVHLVQISIKQGVIQEIGCWHPVFWYRSILRWRSKVDGPRRGFA